MAQATDTGGVIANNGTGDGSSVLLFNTGANNSGFGFSALYGNTSGANNTAMGRGAPPAQHQNHDHMGRVFIDQKKKHVGEAFDQIK